LPRNQKYLFQHYKKIREMVKILANDGIEADGQLLLEEADYEVDTQHVPQEDLPKVLPDYDVIIVRSATKVRKELIDLCPKAQDYRPWRRRHGQY
jgi:phosphoglycerate dehydrogenase-like enzyme